MHSTDVTNNPGFRTIAANPHDTVANNAIRIKKRNTSPKTTQKFLDHKLEALDAHKFSAPYARNRDIQTINVGFRQTKITQPYQRSRS